MMVKIDKKIVRICRVCCNSLFEGYYFNLKTVRKASIAIHYYIIKNGCVMFRIVIVL